MSSAVPLAAGLVAAAALTCAAVLMRPGRARSLAMLGALVLLPVLVLGDQWESERIAALRDAPARLLAGVLVALAAVIGLAAVFRRWPVVMPLAIAAAIPFRVPLQAGDDQANLLVPLYLVIAAAVLWVSVRDRRVGGPVWLSESGWARRLSYAVVVVIALYALQSLYSSDLSEAVQHVSFFMVPFTLLFVLIRECEWTPRLLGVLGLVFLAEAVVFTLFGSWEYAVRTLIWNDEVIRANEFHTYFRVNSLFWDPNMYGRFLALVAVGLTAVMLWARELRVVAAVAVLLGLIWFGLFTSFSLSSLTALLAGLAVLAGVRWSLRWTLVVAGICLGAGVVYAFNDGGFETDWGLANRTSGRSDLITGGLELFGKRPLTGYGSASFAESYAEQIAGGDPAVTESHTEPITVAAEQGLPGLAAYLALIAAALGAMTAGLRSGVGPRAGGPGSGGPGAGGTGVGTGGLVWRISATTQGWFGPEPVVIARAAILAAFIALLVHTVSYAGFFDDPVTWLLLALAATLAPAARVQAAPAAPDGRAERQTPG